MKKFLIITLIVFISTIFCFNSSAQTRRTPQSPNKSVLTEVELPAGGLRITESDKPNEVKTKLAELIASINKSLPAGSKTKFRQGNSEVISWAGISKDKSESEQLKQKIESNFTAANWKYESNKNKDVDPISFSLSRTQPKSRQLTGFFMKDADALILVIAELISVDADKEIPSVGGGATSNVDVTGKWNMIGEAMGQSIPVTLELKQSGETVSGMFSSHLGNGTIQDIKVIGNELDAVAKVEVQGKIVEFKLKGNVDGDKMKGVLNGKGLPPINFTATRAK